MTLSSQTAAVPPRTGRPVLLAPAAGVEGALQAFQAGADAVYVGLKGWSRGGARNELTHEQVRECVGLARTLDKKIELAVNVIPAPLLRGGLLECIRALHEIGITAVIVNDVGFLREIRRSLPELHITASIGCGALNSDDALLYQDLGANAVVFPGYLDPREIADVKRRSAIKVEVMLHMVEEFNQLGKCWMPSYVRLAGGDGGEKIRLSGSVKRSGTGSCYRLCQQPWSLQQNSVAILDRTLPARQISRLPDVSAFIDAGVDVIKLQGRSLAPQEVAALVAVYHATMTHPETANISSWPALQTLPPKWTVQGR